MSLRINFRIVNSPINRYGEQRTRQLRPRCIGTLRSRTQSQINQSINKSISQLHWKLNNTFFVNAGKYVALSNLEYRVLHNSSLSTVYIPDNDKTHCDILINCPIFLSSFNQICIFSTDSHKSTQCYMSRKFVGWEMRSYMWTDGRS